MEVRCQFGPTLNEPLLNSGATAIAAAGWLIGAAQVPQGSCAKFTAF